MKKHNLFAVFTAVFTLLSLQSFSQAICSSQFNGEPKIYRAQASNEENGMQKQYNLQENEYYLGYCDANDVPVGVGNMIPNIYEAAIHITPELAQEAKGHQVKVIRVGLYDPKNVTDGKVWLKKNLNDATCLVEQECDFTQLENSYIDVVLDTPYEVEGNDFYIGYTLTITKIENQGDNYPLGTAGTDHPDGFWMRSGTGPWSNFDGMQFGRLTLLAVCYGEFLKNDIALSSIQTEYLLKGTEGIVEVNFLNKGKDPVNTLDVEYTLGGVTQTATGLTVGNVPCMANGKFELTVSAPNEAGETDLSVKVLKVNNEEDGDMSNNEMKRFFGVLSQSGKRKVLFEEATALWCGFCPRGAVALERLAKERPDDIVSIAVHSNDVFTVNEYTPLFALTPGFPGAVLDRKLSCDPYFGTSTGTPMGIINDIDNLLKEVTPVDVELKVNSISDGTAEVQADVTFYTSMSQNKIRLAYVLIEDGLVGDQKNYYSGDTSVPDDLKPYIDLPQVIEGCEINHVARSISAYEGEEAWKGEPVELGATLSHIYTVNTVLVNTKKSKVAVIVLDENLNVINTEVVSLEDPGVSIDQKQQEAKPKVLVSGKELSVRGTGNMYAEVFSANGLRIASRSFEGETSFILDQAKGIYFVRIKCDETSVVQKIIL